MQCLNMVLYTIMMVSMLGRQKCMYIDMHFILLIVSMYPCYMGSIWVKVYTFVFVTRPSWWCIGPYLNIAFHFIIKMQASRIKQLNEALPHKNGKFTVGKLMWIRCFLILNHLHYISEALKWNQVSSIDHENEKRNKPKQNKKTKKNIVKIKIKNKQQQQQNLYLGHFHSFQGFTDIMQGLVALNLFNEDESVDFHPNGSHITWVHDNTT
jgi:hypothetical protein